MALLKSTIFSSIRGSIAGTTYAQNRYGMYARSRTVPVNPDSSRQNTVRSTLAIVSQTWRTLTDAQQLSWDNYAAETPIVNKLGDTIYMSGFNAFVKTNQLFYLANPPAIQENAPIAPGLANKLNIIDFTIDSSASTAPGVPNQLLITSAEGRESNAGAFNFFYVSNPVSAGKRFYKGPWNYISVIAGDDDPFGGIIPFPALATQRFFVRYVQMDQTGRVSAETIAGPVAAVTVTA
jgi:hypothetical protein